MVAVHRVARRRERPEPADLPALSVTRMLN
jgi:hypothetical protein